MNIYRTISPNTLNGDLEIMINQTLLDYETIKKVLFSPYLKYRDDIAIHLKNYESKSYGFNMFGEGEGYDYIYTPLEDILLAKSSPIIEKHKAEFIDDLKFMLDLRNEPTNTIDEEDEADFSKFIIEGATEQIYRQDTFFQLEFNKLLERLEEDYKNKIIQQIAFKKIKRNKLFILGLSMKLSMRDCGFKLVSVK